jgi:hypothetical protein
MLKRRGQMQANPSIFTFFVCSPPHPPPLSPHAFFRAAVTFITLPIFSAGWCAKKGREWRWTNLAPSTTYL